MVAEVYLHLSYNANAWVQGRLDGIEWQYRYSEVYPALPTLWNEEDGRGIWWYQSFKDVYPTMPKLGYKEEGERIEWQYRYSKVYPALPTLENEEEGREIQYSGSRALETLFYNANAWIQGRRG